MKKFLYLSITSVLFLSLTSFYTSTWELQKNDSGIKVYTRKEGGSDVKSVRITTSLDVSLNAIVSLLSDIPSFNEWVYNCKGAKVLKGVSNTELYRYQITTAPWPVENRDLITHVRISQDASKTVSITGIAVPDMIPVNKDMVRVRKMAESWKLIPKPGKKVDIEYEIVTDPGGNVPSSVMNAFIVDGPFESVKKFKEFAHHTKYVNAKSTVVKEL